jgi:hypothetical protein
MHRLKIVVRFGSGSYFVVPSANMSAVLTDTKGIVFVSTNSRMWWCFMFMVLHIRGHRVVGEF